MPHLLLECTSNIQVKPQEILSSCNNLLVDIANAKREGCKSRLLFHENYCIGNGEKENAFVHITVKLLPGRSEETKEKLGMALLELCKKHISQKNLQITVEILDLNMYCKEVIK